MGDQIPQGYWKAFFEFANSVGASTENSGNVNQPPRQMSDQDRKWLEGAMAQVVRDTDPVRQMKDKIEILSKLELEMPSENDIEIGVQALQDLQDICVQIDYAGDFHKVGGFRLLVPFLSCRCVEFRAETATLVGEITQNQPYIQTQLKEAKILPFLLEMVENDPDVNVRTKTLFAISALLRSNTEISIDFLSIDGFGYLIRAMSASSDNLRFMTKATFLISFLVQDESYRDSLCKSGVVEQLIGLLLTDTNSAQFIIPALDNIVKSNDEAAKICLNQSALREFLINRRKEIDPEDKDEQESINNLLKMWPEKVNYCDDR